MVTAREQTNAYREQFEYDDFPRLGEILDAIAVHLWIQPPVYRN